jgi:hypothetical protein
MGPGSFPNLSCKREVSMAISVEVSELVENFQWLTEEQSYALDQQRATATIENSIPLTNRRVNFILTGKDTKQGHSVDGYFLEDIL